MSGFVVEVMRDVCKWCGYRYLATEDGAGILRQVASWVIRRWMAYVQKQKHIMRGRILVTGRDYTCKGTS
jgi:hypothetical protein